jgi:hypothetical protein
MVVAWDHHSFDDQGRQLSAWQVCIWLRSLFQAEVDIGWSNAPATLHSSVETTPAAAEGTPPVGNFH